MRAPFAARTLATHRRVVFVAFGVGLLLRILMILALKDRAYPDELSYWQVGGQICQGSGYRLTSDGLDGFLRAGEQTAYWGCVTPLLAAAIQFVFGDQLIAGRLIIGTLSFAAGFWGMLLYLRATPLRDSPVVPLTLGIYSAYPNFHFLGSFVMSETVFLPAVLFGMACWRRFANEGGLQDGLGCGIAFGLAHLTRPVFGPIHLVLLAAVAWKFRDRRDAWVRVALSALMTGLVLSPWAVRNFRTFGSVVLETKSGWNLWWANNPNAYEKVRHPLTTTAMPPVPTPDFSGADNEHERSKRMGALFRDWVWRHPDQFSFLCAARFRELLALTPRFVSLPGGIAAGVAVLNAALYLFAALGAVLCVRRRMLLEAVLIVGYVWVLCSMTIASPRHRSAADPFLLILAATGIIAIATRWTVPSPMRNPE